MLMKLSIIASKAARELKWGHGYHYSQGRHCMLGAILHYRLGHNHCLKTMVGPDTQYYSPDTLKMSAKESKAISIDEIWQKNDDGGWDFARFAREFKKLGI